MREIFTTALVLITINCFGQQWVEYRIDSILSATIPDNYQVVDTMGQRIIRAQIENALIMLTKSREQITVTIQNEKELIDVYKGLQNGLIKSQEGKLINSKIIKRNGLSLTKFSYHATMGDEKQVRHCLGVFVNKNMYVIHFWELEGVTNKKVAERERLFSSLKFPADITLKNQMISSTETSDAYNVGYFIGKMIGIFLIIGLPISFVIIWASRKARRKKPNAP